MVQAQKLVARFFDLAGLQISRKGTHVRLERRIDAAIELDGIYRKLVFPQLPSNTRRASLLAQLQGTQISEAIYVLDALHKSLALPGDICEFGVAQGTTSALMANEILSTEKNLWLFDSFEGLPRPTDKDVLIDDIFNLGSIEKYAGQMASPQSEMLNRLRNVAFPLTRAKIVPGFIEKTIGNPGLPKQVCFSYVDFDFYEPIKIALEFLHDRLPVGGHIVVDDYGFFSAGAKTSVDEFVASHQACYELSLPFEFAGHFAVLKRIQQ